MCWFPLHSVNIQVLCWEKTLFLKTILHTYPWLVLCVTFRCFFALIFFIFSTLGLHYNANIRCWQRKGKTGNLPFIQSVHLSLQLYTANKQNTTCTNSILNRLRVSLLTLPSCGKKKLQFITGFPPAAAVWLSADTDTCHLHFI